LRLNQACSALQISLVVGEVLVVEAAVVLPLPVVVAVELKQMLVGSLPA
jgi:hypothetical protein